MTTPPSPGQWPAPPPGPPPLGPPPAGQRKSSAAKWILGGLAILVVVVVSVVTTLLVTRDGEESAGPSPTPGTTGPTTNGSAIASSYDRRPAGIVLEDPTCVAWTPIAASFANAAENGWGDRDPAIAENKWTSDQRAQYEAVGAALRSSADRTVELAIETPNRVMNELYSQFIAYARAYANALPSYVEADDHLIRVAIGASSALSAICSAIDYGSAGARSPLVAAAAPTPGRFDQFDPEQPARLLESGNPICGDWLAAINRFDDAIAAWKVLDPNVPANEMSLDQRAVLTSVKPTMVSFASQAQQLGRQSDIRALSDLATLAAQYLRAYASALTTYTPADNYLQLAASASAGVITEACRAAGA